MFKLLKTYWVNFLLLLSIVISIVGMIVTKGRIEHKQGAIHENELLFTLFQILFVGTLIYITANWLFNKWKEYKLLKNEKLKAEIINLKNQISPHFFFNTLNNLYGLIKKDADEAQDFVLKLSDLMRYAIYSSDNEMVSIEEEVIYIKNFISLHQIRHAKNVDVQFKKDIQEKNKKIYSLLLIVLVENAFKHGVEKLVDNAYIHCSLESDNNRLTLTVVNNFDVQNQKDIKGVGLNNLKKRLELLYPNKHILTFEQKENVFKAYLEIPL